MRYILVDTTLKCDTYLIFIVYVNGILNHISSIYVCTYISLTLSVHVGSPLS